MAKKNIMDALLDLESDELSLETTVPTDLSLSPGDDTVGFGDSSDFNAQQSKRKVGQQMLAKKQMMHDIQLLKIELSQKSLFIDNLKADYLQRVEELEEKLSDALHGKQILQARLESQLNIQQEEARSRQEKIQHELDLILKRQQQLEETNDRLQEKATDIKRSLQDLGISEKQYQEIKSQNEDDLSLKDYVAMKLHETVKPWKIENEDLRTKVSHLTADLHKKKTELNRCQDEIIEVKQSYSDLHLKYEKMVLAFADIKSQVQQGDFKIENYDRVKRERDEFETELTELRQRFAYLEAGHHAVTKERDELSSELSATKQSAALLRQDKDFFSKQVSDMHNKMLYMEEKVLTLNDQLDKAKQSREDLYDKYVASRDKYRSEYERKLQEELEQIRTRTNTEIDRLKSSTREMYERENRNLREARDMAVEEKDRAVAAERQAELKCDHLMQQYRELQTKTDNTFLEQNNELKLKAFETERTQMVQEETSRMLKEGQIENDKLQRKLQVMMKEYSSLQTSLEKQIVELESSVKEKTSKLEVYEKLEQELDDVVMQAAEVENEEDAERVLFSYGYGANVPTTSKRRLKQSVHLAQRVLQLERANTSLRKEVDRETTSNKQLAEELDSTNSILTQAQQPYHYLVDGMRQRDLQLRKQKEHITTLEDDYGRLEKEKVELVKMKNNMAADLERLLNQKEELSVMKQVVLNLSQRKGGGSKTSRSSTPRRAGKDGLRSVPTAIHQPENVFEPVKGGNNVIKPEPTKFNENEIPSWYKRLQASNTGLGRRHGLET